MCTRYGQNQEDVFLGLKATELQSGKEVRFTKPDCKFGYRESVFKHGLKDYLVTSVTYQLSKTPHFDTSYHSRYESLAAELPRSAGLPEIMLKICGFEHIFPIIHLKEKMWVID